MSTCQDEKRPIEDCSDCNQMNVGSCPFAAGYNAALAVVGKVDGYTWDYVHGHSHLICPNCPGETE